MIQKKNNSMTKFRLIKFDRFLNSHSFICLFCMIDVKINYLELTLRGKINTKRYMMLDDFRIKPQ